MPGDDVVDDEWWLDEKTTKKKKRKEDEDGEIGAIWTPGVSMTEEPAIGHADKQNKGKGGKSAAAPGAKRKRGDSGDGDADANADAAADDDDDDDDDDSDDNDDAPSPPKLQAGVGSATVKQQVKPPAVTLGSAASAAGAGARHKMEDALVAKIDPAADAEGTAVAFSLLFQLKTGGDEPDALDAPHLAAPPPALGTVDWSWVKAALPGCHKRLKGKSGAAGGAAAAPTLLVVCASAVRACAVIKALRGSALFASTPAAKLFAKHMKLGEQAKQLAKQRPALAVGTPHRLKQLVEAGALDLSGSGGGDGAARAVVAFDMQRDAKSMTLLTSPETSSDLMQFFSTCIRPHLAQGRVKVAFV